MFSRRFVPLEVRPVVIERLDVHPPVMEQPKAVANDDVEDITDDEEEVQKPNQQQNVIVVNKPQIIVVKKQPVVKPTVKQNDVETNVISAEFDSLIDDIVACYEIEKREEEKEKRRKERQRIKRKKANKRRYQKMLWARRYKHII